MKTTTLTSRADEVFESFLKSRKMELLIGVEDGPLAVTKNNLYLALLEGVQLGIDIVQETVNKRDQKFLEELQQIYF